MSFQKQDVARAWRCRRVLLATSPLHFLTERGKESESKMTRSESSEGSRSLTDSCLPPLLIQLEEAEEKATSPGASRVAESVTHGGEPHVWGRASRMEESITRGGERHAWGRASRVRGASRVGESVTHGGERHAWRRASCVGESGGLSERSLPPLRLQTEPNACGKGRSRGVIW